MNPSLQVPTLVTSPLMPRKGAAVSLLDDDVFETYPYGTYGLGVNENADHLGYQTSYNDLFPKYGQTFNYAASVPEDQGDLTYNHGANLDASSQAFMIKEPSETPVQPGACTFGKSTPQKNFVRKLYEMLSDEMAQEFIHWNSDGKSFVIDNQDDFAKNVLGRYLKTGNFQSFIRQLNMYDFHKTNKAQRAQRGVQAQSQQFVFSHPKFQKDKPELLSDIKRKGAEQQDPPPQYESLLSAARFGPSQVQGHLSLGFPQFDHQSRILLQAENARLKQENEELKAAYQKLVSEHSTLKASLQPARSTRVSQAQIEGPSSALTTHSTFLDGNTSNQSFELTRNGNLYGFDYNGSPAVEGSVVFQQYTGATVHTTSGQGPSIMNPSLLSLESTPLPGPSTNAPSPNINRIRQSSPQQPRTTRKERPTSWYKNLGQIFLGGGSYDEAGPSTAANVFPQDAHVTHNANYGKAHVGTRAQPVMRVADYHT